MNKETEKLRIVRLRKKRGNFHALLSQVVIIAFFLAAYFLAVGTGAGAAERTGAFVLLATIVLTLGLTVACLPVLHDGIDLERRPSPGNNRSQA